jgi:hypothetical protein
MSILNSLVSKMLAAVDVLGTIDGSEPTCQVGTLPSPDDVLVPLDARVVVLVAYIQTVQSTLLREGS